MKNPGTKKDQAKEARVVREAAAKVTQEKKAKEDQEKKAAAKVAREEKIQEDLERKEAEQKAKEARAGQKRHGSMLKGVIIEDGTDGNPYGRQFNKRVRRDSTA